MVSGAAWTLSRAVRSQSILRDIIGHWSEGSSRALQSYDLIGECFCSSRNLNKHGRWENKRSELSRRPQAVSNSNVVFGIYPDSGPTCLTRIRKIASLPIEAALGCWFHIIVSRESSSLVPNKCSFNFGKRKGYWGIVKPSTAKALAC
ncbi:hypothetical protein AVEN_121793-1 [Araneus ventricosus]|uniref:Uncharacterized protein n=1 Tax=Araneus ventricosus TaxID=182803 RepID=A0A4Y2I991_ARAVE|nr:hypothetical protein AVEN_121793-1 [Araneus ventricosus]